MLVPGGFLLSNNAVLELPSSNVRSVGYVTVQYSDRADDADHVLVSAQLIVLGAARFSRAARLVAAASLL
jgi:hypothetical protein